MEYGAIDLHKKESQIRIVTDSGEMIDRRDHYHAGSFDARVRGQAEDADSDRGVDRERMGGAAPRADGP